MKGNILALFFDIEKLETAAASDIDKFLALLEFHYNGKVIPKTSRTSVRPVKLAGSSFILNPAPLFKPSKIDKLYIVQYIKLAARRDFMMYKLYRQATLDLTFFPDLNTNLIRGNPILAVEANTLVFQYELQYTTQQKA